MVKKKKKVEYYIDLVERIVDGKSSTSYIEAVLNPDKLKYIIAVKSEVESKTIWTETVSVWKDAISWVNNSIKYELKDKKEKILDVIKARLDWITDNYTDSKYNEYKKIYMYNYDEYEKYFDKRVIKVALDNTLLYPFVKIGEAYDYSIAHCENLGYLKLEKCSKMVDEKVNGRYVRVVKHGYKFLFPNPFQAHLMSEFTKKCALLQYPFLEKYNCLFYGIDSIAEFYIPMDKDSNCVLYIPFECLSKKSIKPAIDRMNTYFREYYGEKAQEHLDSMNTEVFRNLKRDIEGDIVQNCIDSGFSLV